MVRVHGNGRNMEREKNKSIDALIECAIELRDRGVDNKRLIRTCLFLAVLFAFDEELNVHQLVQVLERMFERTGVALNLKEGFVMDETGDA